MTSYGDITGNAGYLGKPVTEMVINRDGSASFWYMKEVHNFDRGDVNHDGVVNITDMTVLIDYLLSGSESCCPICADVNEKDGTSIADVTAIIDKLLSGN